MTEPFCFEGDNAIQTAPMPLQGLRVTKTSTAKFLNGTLKAADYKDLIQVVHTYGNVTFKDFTIDAIGTAKNKTEYAGYAVRVT